MKGKRYSCCSAFIMVLVFLCFSVSVFGETICLYTRFSEENSAPEAVEYFSVLEGGVMDAFFEEGHIIFNTPFKDLPKDPYGKSSSSVFLSRNGGASYLLEVTMTLETAGSKKIQLVGVDFCFMNLVGDREVGRDSFPVDLLRLDSSRPEIIAYSVGREIGIRALRMLN